MRFLKDNSFYIGLILAIIVVGGGQAYLAMSIDGGNDQEQAKREKASKVIESLSSGRMINDMILRSRSEAVTKDKTAVRRIADESLEWNRGGRQVLSLPKYEDAAKVGDVPAFPIDEKLYSRYDLGSYFARLYNQALAKMLTDLSVTRRPTDAEKNVHVMQVQARLDQVALREAELAKALEEKASGSRTSGSTTNTPRSTTPLRRPETGSSDPRMREMTGPAGRMRDVRPPTSSIRPPSSITRRSPSSIRPPIISGSRTSGSDRGSSAARRTSTSGGDAQSEGTIIAVLEKARAGLLYADMAALNPVMASQETDVDNARLFNGQVGLWVIGDIMKAIKLTIDDGLKPASDATPLARNVLNSPIKRIVNIKVEDSFAVGDKGSGGKIVGGSVSSGRSSASSTGSTRLNRDPRRGGGFDPRGRMGGSGGSTGGSSRTTTSVDSGLATLTQRVSNPRYDVQRYSFTLVMDVKYLPALQKHLMQQNVHTVLLVEMEKVGSVDSESGYYYGTTPVMNVTITGELVLLADWTRGRWITPDNPRDKDKGRWDENYPPLMPVEVLKSMHARDDSALRSEDIERAGLAKTSASTGSRRGRNR